MLSRVPPAITPPFTTLTATTVGSAPRRRRKTRAALLHPCLIRTPTATPTQAQTSMLSLGKTDQRVIVQSHKAQPTRKARLSDKATQTLSNAHGKACEAFFKRHTVFTAEAFHAHLAVHGAKPSAQQCIRILREYVEAGRLHPLRPGAYLTRTAARSLDQEPITNLIQIAAHMPLDAVLAYHCADNPGTNA